MQEVKKCAAQGDVILRKVRSIPKTHAAVPRKGPIIVSHSETGHHHVVNAEGVTLFEHQTDKTSLVCYLQMGDCTSFDVEHLRSYDTHETLRLLGKPGAIWEARRQREHTPEGWRRVQD